MANTVTELSRGSGVDSKELGKLTRDFMDWKPDKALHKMLKQAGELIAADAKAIVRSDYKASYKERVGDRGEQRHYKGSVAVGESIKVRVSKTRVSVVAGGDGIPLAGLWEMGNKTRGKSAAASSRGEFRHPVFGAVDRWVNQPMHPFLLPAAKKNERGIEALEGKAVAEAFRERDLTVT